MHDEFHRTREKRNATYRQKKLDALGLRREVNPDGSPKRKAKIKGHNRFGKPWIQRGPDRRMLTRAMAADGCTPSPTASKTAAMDATKKGLV